MARKKRVPIPPDTDALVRYAADRTCCVCRVPGRPLPFLVVACISQDTTPPGRGYTHARL
jgi:hypothetical protein